MALASLLRSAHTRVVAVAGCGFLLACSKEPPPPPYEANPDAKDMWEVVVTVHDAPHGLVATRAYVYYSIANTACLPPINSYTGIRRERDFHILEVDLKRIDQTRSSGQFYRDGMLKKNYYGHGSCRWTMQFVGAFLSTESTKHFTYFSVSTTPDRSPFTLYAKKDIQPRLESRTRMVARTWNVEDMKKIPGTEHKDYFAFEIAILEKRPER